MEVDLGHGEQKNDSDIMYISGLTRNLLYVGELTDNEFLALFDSK